MGVFSGMDIRSKGALSGEEDPAAIERPRSGPLFAMLSSRVSKKVGVTVMVMVWGREVAWSTRPDTAHLRAPSRRSGAGPDLD